VERGRKKQIRGNIKQANEGNKRMWKRSRKIRTSKRRGDK